MGAKQFHGCCHCMAFMHCEIFSLGVLFFATVTAVRDLWVCDVCMKRREL